MIRKAPFFSGLFLLCASILMLQIIQTRVLSVVSMYYMAFLSISMAMLGMTAGALLVYFKFREHHTANVAAHLSRIATGFGLAILVCFVVQLASPVFLVKSGTVVVVWLKTIILLAMPFTLGGMAVSLALTRTGFGTGITYGVDLLGAAFGCLAALILLNIIDAASAMFAVAGMTAVTGVLFRMAAPGVIPFATSRGWKLLNRPGIVAFALFGLALANASTRYGLQPVSAKFGHIESNADFEFETWNSFSRVTATYSATERPHLWGPSPDFPARVVAEQRHLSIDGGAGTIMPHFTGDNDEVSFLRYDITNLVYAARNTGRAAVIGVGSGRDLLSAHVFGFHDITGVELNPAFIDFLTDPRKLRGYAGIADLPGMRLIVDEGRSWFARTGEKFDLIQMSMIDTFAATAAGAFSLSENGLYTVDGWRIFLSALKPDGLFTVSRWHAPSAPVEIGRTVSLATAALMALGVHNPRDHVFLASIGSLATLIVSPSPLSGADLQKLRDAARLFKFNILATPDQATAADPVFQDILSATSVNDLEVKASNYSLDISPPTDARPFFFNQLRPSISQNLRFIVDEYRGTRSYFGGERLVVVGNLIAMSTLILLIALSLLAVVLAIILPARSSIRNVGSSLVILGSTYFLLIGLGFMFIEIGLIQRMSVFMGHPVYALSVVLFGIILTTGLGSLLSERLAPSRAAGLMLWLSLLVAYVFYIPQWLPGFTHALESRSLIVRALACIVVILPAGGLMGFGFPIGMRLVMSRDSRPTPWFWGINGAAGVLAAGLAVACSIGFSVDTTLRVGGACYLFLAPVAVLLSLPGSGVRDWAPRF
jgi:hypothetical protein